MKRILLFLTPLVIIGCQKRLPSTSADQDLVTQARKFFIDSVNSAGPALNYRAAQPRNVLWEQAAVKDLSGGKAVVVPVTFSSPMMVRTNFSGQDYFHLNYLQKTRHIPGFGRKIPRHGSYPVSRHLLFKKPVTAVHRNKICGELGR